MILLDSDVAVDLLRGHPPALQWLPSLGGQQIAIPGFVAMELIAGCHNAQQQKQTEAEIANYRIIWLPPPECDAAFGYFKSYWLSHRLGIFDALIARTAIMVDLPLYTFNVKHFQAVPDLKTIQPYIK